MLVVNNIRSAAIFQNGYPMPLTSHNLLWLTGSEYSSIQRLFIVGHGEMNGQVRQAVSSQVGSSENFDGR